MAARGDLDAREYKLLLEPRKFPRGPDADAANAFWLGHVVPIVDCRLGPRKSGRPRHEGHFDLTLVRRVRYWDTGDRLFDDHGFCLRDRRVLGEDDAVLDHQITLKLRTPDFFAVGAESLVGSRNSAETKLEEDIAPLEVPVGDGPSGTLVVARPRSFRSRFARSTTQSVKGGLKLRKIARAFEFFPTLKASLKRAKAEFDRDADLHRGELAREYVYRGASVRLGRGLRAELAFTLWYFGSGESAPEVAEISYKVMTECGGMAGPPARRAADLFVGLQEDLGDWVNLRDSSKTELALPPRRVSAALSSARRARGRVPEQAAAR